MHQNLQRRHANNNFKTDDRNDQVVTHQMASSFLKTYQGTPPESSGPHHWAVYHCNHQTIASDTLGILDTCHRTIADVIVGPVQLHSICAHTLLPGWCRTLDQRQIPDCARSTRPQISVDFSASWQGNNICGVKLVHQTE